MSRVQLALNVDDLDAAVDCHSKLFATGCYARQDKVWVDGPSGEPWEIYTVLEDVEMPAGQLRTVDPETGTVCCAVVGEDGSVAAGSTSCC